jgi:hypothetical protein
MKLWVEVLDTTNGAGTYAGVFDEVLNVPDHIPYAPGERIGGPISLRGLKLAIDYVLEQESGN